MRCPNRGAYHIYNMDKDTCPLGQQARTPPPARDTLGGVWCPVWTPWPLGLKGEGETCPWSPTKGDARPGPKNFFHHFGDQEIILDHFGDFCSYVVGDGRGSGGLYKNKIPDKKIWAPGRVSPSLAHQGGMPRANPASPMPRHLPTCKGVGTGGFRRPGGAQVMEMT